MRLRQWRSSEERERSLRVPLIFAWRSRPRHRARGIASRINRIATFEACSGFTHVKARAQPPKATVVTGLQPTDYSGQASPWAVLRIPPCRAQEGALAPNVHGDPMAIACSGLYRR